MSYVNIEELYGKTLTHVEHQQVGLCKEDALLFYCYDGTSYKMYHDQSCCENVYLEDIAGELGDLIGSPLTVAQERSNINDTEDGVEQWTFYELATAKGSVTLRWYGTSNGYYSTSVSIEKLT